MSCHWLSLHCIYLAELCSSQFGGCSLKMIGECCDSHIFINLAKLSSESLLRRLKKPILKKFKAQQDAQHTLTKKILSAIDKNK